MLSCFIKNNYINYLIILVASCKERWRNIRAAFARSINIYKTHGGPNRVKPYYLHKELTFLIKPMLDGREKADGEGIIDGKDDVESIDANGEMTLDDILLDHPELEQDQEEFTDTLNVRDDQNSNADVASDAEAEFNSNITNATLLRKVRRHIAALNSNNNNNNSNVQNNNNITAEEPELKRMRLNNSFVASGQPTLIAAPSLCRIKTEDAGENSYDADVKFLEALLPDMRCMNARQKVIFKRKIYQSLEEVFDTTNDFPYSTHNTSFYFNSSQHAGAAAAVTAVPTENLLSASALNLSDTELQRMNSYMDSQPNSSPSASPNNESSNVEAPARSATAPPLATQNADNQNSNSGHSSPAPPPLTPAPVPAAQQPKRSNSSSGTSQTNGSTITTRSSRRSIRVAALPKEKDSEKSSDDKKKEKDADNQSEDGNNNNSQRPNPPWDQLVPIAVKEEIDDVDID